MLSSQKKKITSRCGEIDKEVRGSVKYVPLIHDSNPSHKCPGSVMCMYVPLMIPTPLISVRGSVMYMPLMIPTPLSHRWWLTWECPKPSSTQWCSVTKKSQHGASLGLYVYVCCNITFALGPTFSIVTLFS